MFLVFGLLKWLFSHFSNLIVSANKIRLRATALAFLKNCLFYTKKPTFFYFTSLFYKTLTSVHLLYIIFYINNFFMSWRERERGEERMWGKINNTKILYRRAIITMHICTVTVALVYLYTILHPLMWVFFWSKCVK